MKETFSELLNFLFKKATLTSPQIGFAGLDKRAWLWLPGKTSKEGLKKKRIIDTAPIKGCTQLSFDNWSENMSAQHCEVCWVGLDIDQDDNEDMDLKEWGLKFAKKHQATMLRYSCSGEGIHLIWVLSSPIPCNNTSAGVVVKNIAGYFRDFAETEGVHVCQSNRRMFWLMGAKNECLYKSEDNLIISSTSINLKRLMYNAKGESSKGNSFKSLKTTDKIKSWIEKFQAEGFIGHIASQSQGIYIGHVVEFLRSEGETVYTKSGCSGNGRINGYIDISNTKISLWAYADGHTIWAYEDVEALMQ